MNLDFKRDINNIIIKILVEFEFEVEVESMKHIKTHVIQISLGHFMCLKG